MIKPAIIIKTEETHAMYVPGAIAGTIFNKLYINQQFEHKYTSVSKLWPTLMEEPNSEVRYWKARFEADGYPKRRHTAYAKIEFNADPEGIYAYAKQFFGPTLDEDCAAEREENLRAVMGENDRVLAQIDAKKKGRAE